LGVAALLVATTLLAHGWSLADGAVLDDHWHQYGLRTHGWSLTELQRTLTIEPAQWLTLWWQTEPARWEYFRPGFILLMKFFYVVIGGEAPWVLHALAIGLHALSAGLIYPVGRRLGLPFLPALGAALAFIVYPHALMTVAWSSSLNVVASTTLTLAAFAAYLKASGVHRSTLAARGTPPPMRWGWYVATLMLWLLALTLRETALILPAVLAATDLAFHPARGLRHRIRVYIPLAALAVVFVILRLQLVQQPMPDVYVQRPEGSLAAYAAWASAKLVHYLATAVWFAPMTIGPTGRLHPWSEAPLDYAFMLGLLAGAAAVYIWLARRRPGWWLWPLWILLAVLPVTPVIATPHSGYLPGIGVAFAVGWIAAGRRTAHRPDWPRLRRTLLVGYLCLASLFTLFNRWQWTAIIAAEQLVVEWVAARPPAATAEHVFFINLPFVNVYAKPALDRRLGPPFTQANAAVLTFAPDAFWLHQHSRLRVRDAHTLELSITGRPYFSGLLGRFLLAGFRNDDRLPPGYTESTTEFTAHVETLEPRGVRTLRFRFERPLNDPRYAFYFTSPACGASRLDFDWLEREQRTPAAPLAAEDAIEKAAAALHLGRAAAGDALLATVVDPASPHHEQAAAAIRPVATFVGAALGGPTVPTPSTTDAWREFGTWWRTRVTDRALADSWLLRNDFNDLIKQREEVPNARMWMRMLIRSDLYLTGPPFPGPPFRSPPAN